MKLKFSFKEYTPIEVEVKNEDIENLNVIFNYLNQGATIKCTNIDNGDNEYFMDMSFEDRSVSIIEWLKLKWFLIKNRWLNK